MTHIQAVSFKKAFSMLELIFVIVILGIVSSIGAEIIANIYESYIVQRAQHRASLKTEIAATQIANRLSYAIPGTVIRRVGIATAAEDINDFPASPVDTYDVLQWVGADADSFKAINSDTDHLPGWSGFCDVNESASPLGGTSISTPGSNLGLASTIITNLGGNIDGAAIYYEANTTLQRRDIAAAGTGGTTITLDNTLGNISEHYKLAWTSYALVVDAAGTLSLHYDFTPTRAINVAGSSSILLRNVSTFKFKGDGRTIRFKICVEEEIGEDFNITICKEKAVF